MKKYYAVLVISHEPIDLGNIAKDPHVQHCVVKEFDHTTDVAIDHNGWKIDKSAPEFCNGVAVIHHGYGESISVVIADWFKNLFRSTGYIPLYFRNRS